MMRRYINRFASFSYNAKVFLIFTLFTNIAITAYMLLFNLYLASLGYGNDTIGRIIAIPGFAMLIWPLPAALLSDRIGRKPLLVLGAGLAAGALLGLALSESLLAIGIFAFLAVTGEGMGWVIGGPFLVENSTEGERLHLFSANFALVMGSGMIGGLLGGAVPQIAARLLAISPDSTLALRYGLLFPVAMQIVAFIVIAKARPYELHPEGRASWADLRANVKLIAKLIAPHVSLGIGAGAMVGFFNLFFAKQFKLAPGSIGVLFAISAATATLATLLSPRLARRFGRIPAVVLTQSCSLPFLAVIAYVPILWPVIISFWVRGALMNMSEPIYNTFALEQVPGGLKATLSSLYLMTWNFGWIVGPMLSGEIQTRSGFPLAFTVTLVCYVISIATTAGFFWNADKARAWRASPTTLA